MISRSHRVTERHEHKIGMLIVDCAVHGYHDLGPGLLVTVSEMVLAAKLPKRGLSVERQVPEDG